MLNWLTIVLGVAAFNDAILGRVIPLSPAASTLAPWSFQAGQWIVAGIALVLSVRPALNLISPNQAMNFSYNALHLVNTYGAFAYVSRERLEIVFEGTEDSEITPATEWKEYELKGKPGNPRRRPPQIAPYHLRLDSMLWFPRFLVRTSHGPAARVRYRVWFVRLVERMLEADPPTLRLFRGDPLAGQRPKFVRARLYRYEYTSMRERRQTRAWWRRTLVGMYLPAVSRADL